MLQLMYLVLWGLVIGKCCSLLWVNLRTHEDIRLGLKERCKRSVTFVALCGSQEGSLLG